MPDRLAHPLHLVLAALVEDELEPAAAEPAGAGGSGAAVLEVDALAQPAERVLVRVAVDVDLVRLLDAVARMREPVREQPVVREQERAGRVGVEPADRDDARLGGNEIDDGAAALRVADRRDDAGGLVQEQVRELLQRDRAAVDLDPVAGSDDGVELPGLAVDEDAAVLDQRVGVPARGDARAGEVGVESHSAERSSPARARLR